GATSTSSHHVVHGGSRPSTAIGRRNSRNCAGATRVGPVRAGNDASTNTHPATGRRTASTITGTKRPALLCATRTIGRSGGSWSLARATVSAMYGQNGGSCSATPSSEGTTATFPESASLARTGAHVSGPTD